MNDLDRRLGEYLSTNTPRVVEDFDRVMADATRRKSPQPRHTGRWVIAASVALAIVVVVGFSVLREHVSTSPAPAEPVNVKLLPAALMGTWVWTDPYRQGATSENSNAPSGQQMGSWLVTFFPNNTFLVQAVTPDGVCTDSGSYTADAEGNFTAKYEASPESVKCAVALMHPAFLDTSEVTVKQGQVTLRSRSLATSVEVPLIRPAPALTASIVHDAITDLPRLQLRSVGWPTCAGVQLVGATVLSDNRIGGTIRTGSTQECSPSPSVPRVSSVPLLDVAPLNLSSPVVMSVGQPDDTRSAVQLWLLVDAGDLGRDSQDS
jgi:hypothetical protein